MLTRLARLLFVLAALSGSLCQAQTLLPAEEAFKFSLRAIDAQTLEARWQIEKGYYLYRDKFRFSAAPVALGAPQLPPGKVHNDEFFGRVETYRKEVRILLPVTGAAGDSVSVKAVSQGCADIGVCYPPLEQQATVKLAAASMAGTPQMSVAPAPASAAAGGGDDSLDIARLLADAGFWTILLFFFASGLALAFTPCMFPMIPIISGIIVGHGHNISKARALLLSLAYVLGMAVTYAAAGVVAGFSGTLIANSLQNVWVLSVFALVFVALALSMFGFYELQLPSFLQSKVSEEANRQKAGSLHGVALMGILSALIVGPCVAAPLAGALLYIARTGDAALGGTALFVMALGMGAPLVIIATSARHLLPRSGPWMEAIRKVFGVLLLAVAIWLVTPFIPAVAQMLAWALLFIFSAIYLHALDPVPAQAHGWQRFGKGLGVVLLLAGAALLAGALGGSRDLLQPLGFLRAQATAPGAATPRFERVATVAALDARLAAAGGPVMLDFYADWCVTCKEMERYTFTDAAVTARMENMLLLQADVSSDSADDRALLKRFGLFGPPGIIFFDARGREIEGLRVIGFKNAAAFAAILDRALAAD